MILILLGENCSFWRRKCVGQCIYMLLDKREHKSSNIFITPDSLTLSSDDHNSMTDGQTYSCTLIVWFGITMLQKPKRNYTCNSANQGSTAHSCNG